jgi:hypothetical protein
MWQISTECAPRLLTNKQKRRHVFVCQDLLDEDSYNPETKLHSSQWKSPFSPHLKKARQVRSNIKSMVASFFY